MCVLLSFHCFWVMFLSGSVWWGTLSKWAIQEILVPHYHEEKKNKVCLLRKEDTV